MAAPEPVQPPRERRSLAFLLVLMALGLVAVATMLLAPLEALLPPGIEVPRILLLVQPALLVIGCALLGWWAAPKVGLDAPVLGALTEKGDWASPLRTSVWWGLLGGLVAAGVLVAYGLLTAGFFAQERAGLELPMFTRVLYGGVAEEIMLRWGVLSLLALIAAKLGLALGTARWTANAAAALLFAAGHLPALFALVDPPGWLIAAVIAGNAAAGIVFGWLFIRRGLEAAMIAHAVAHLAAVPVLVALA
jgi:membrane protease YdiL (CAAX protease family)